MNFKVEDGETEKKLGEESKFLPEVNQLHSIPSQTLMMITDVNIFSISPYVVIYSADFSN